VVSEVVPYFGLCPCMNPTPYTLHPTPYTLHPTPYTLHPKPRGTRTSRSATYTPTIYHMPWWCQRWGLTPASRVAMARVARSFASVVARCFGGWRLQRTIYRIRYTIYHANTTYPIPYMYSKPGRAVARCFWGWGLRSRERQIETERDRERDRGRDRDK